MHGFTLLELLIVMLVLGILAGLAFPVLAKSVTDARLRGAVSEVATALRYAKASAMSTGRTCRVVFAVGASKETAEVSQVVHGKIDKLKDTGLSEMDDGEVDDAALLWNWEQMDNPIHPGAPYTIDFLAAEAFGGVDIVSATFGAGTTVEFDARGAASDDGTVVIGFGGRQASIQVDDESGRISVIP